MGKTVLQFSLQIIGETITERGVDAPDVVSPLDLFIVIRKGSEQLLIPADSGVELGC